MLNHWADLFPPRLRANRPFLRERVILHRAHRCARERGMPVNLIAVDFYDQGPLIDAVDELNGERIRAHRRALAPPPPPAGSARPRRPGSTACEDRPMVTSTGPRRRLGAVLREEERVTPLELFFDLVFVLALTQCTALMADEPTWGGLAKGLLVLGVLWWAWVGYAWLTSVVDPEEGAVRLAIFAAMAALLVVALCVPDAFGDLGADVRARLRGRARRAHRAVRPRQPRRPRDAEVGRWGSRSARRSGSGCWSARRSSTASRRARCGPSRSGSTWSGRSCSAPRAGSSSPGTSPSATA